jgi:methyl-accepting chemotaxis protein
VFKNLSLASRLATSFSVLAVTGLSIAGYGAVTLKGMSGELQEVAQNRMVKVAQFTELMDNFNAGARAVRNIIIIDDVAARDQEKQKLIDLRKKNGAILDDLEKTITLPKAREFLKTIVDNRGPYNAGLDQAIELAYKGDRTAAGAKLIREVRPLQSTVFKAAGDSREFQKASADRMATEAAGTAALAGTVMVGLGIAMSVLAAVVGWLLIRSMVGRLQLAQATAERVAAGDLTGQIDVQSQDEVGKVLQALERMQASLAQVVMGVRQNSESVATASAQIAQGNQDLSSRTEEQASALQQTAATMEQLGSTVRNNADSAKQANQLAQGASAVAERGGVVVGQVVATMQGISQSSRKIGDIIGVIDGIAFQTNILALNAAVEAARAGEQGRGFAVVASEVRSLAQRSAEAAKQIKTLIGQSVEQVEQGTALVDQAGKTMSEIVGSIQRVSDIVAEITSASAEQSGGVQQVGEAVSQMDQATQQNAALVEESAAAAESLKGQAQQLVEAVAVFKLSTPDGRTSPAHFSAQPSHSSGMEHRSDERAKNVARAAAFSARRPTSVAVPSRQSP